VSGVIVIPPNERESAPLELEAGTWRWNPQWIVSEKHWLKCGEVIPEHSLCPICGERD